MMRGELGESWDHLRAATMHAASGFGQSVGPRATMLRGAAMRGWGSTASALAPLAVAYREGAADAVAAASRMRRKAPVGRMKMKMKMGKRAPNGKMGMLFGLLAAGAALGAVGALVVRRRRKREWSEYEATGALDSMSADARAMMEKAATKGGSTMDKLAQNTGRAMDKTADKLSSAASSMRTTDVKGKAGERASDAAERMASKSGGSSPESGRP